MAQSKQRALHCSWCGKSQDEVGKLIAGPNVFICDECVVLCAVVVAPDAEEEFDAFLERIRQEKQRHRAAFAAALDQGDFTDD